MKSSLSISSVIILFSNQIHISKQQNVTPPATGTTIDFLVATTRTAADCIPRTSNCYKVHAEGGCDNRICEDTVCACDPYCCDVLWDLSCSGYPDNYFNPECSARLLCCQQPIEPYTPVCETIIPSTSNCLVPHAPDAGCDDAICEALVCDCDPYCCTSGGWDVSCAGYPDNYFNKGCSAKTLCCTDQEIPNLVIGATSIPALPGPTSSPTPIPTYSLPMPDPIVSSPTLPPSLMPITSPVMVSITVPAPPTEYCDCYRERIPIIATR